MGVKEIEQEIVDKAEKDGKGPLSYMILDWNRSTQQMFRKGKKPRQGARFVLRCSRSDGKRMYFELEEQ